MYITKYGTLKHSNSEEGVETGSHFMVYVCLKLTL